MAGDQVSSAVARAWGVAATPQRGPKRELSTERIVAAAVDIADTDGLGAVTMQRVAGSFGYTTMAIYRYVSSKDELELLMLDAAFVDPPLSEPAGGWRDELRVWIDWLFAGYRAHPWVLEIQVGMVALLMPSQMRAADAALHAMRDLRASDEERLELLVSLTTFVRGMAIISRDLSGERAVVNQATMSLVRELATPTLLPALAPLVASGIYFGMPAEGEDATTGVEAGEFDTGIDIWLAGVEATFGSRGGPLPREQAD